MTIKNWWLLLSLLLGMSLVACEPATDDDDSADDDDDDSADDDDDSAADDDDDAEWHALLTYGAWGSDATLATIAVDGLIVSDGALGLSGSDWLTTSADGSPWLIGRFGTDAARRYDGLDFSAPTLEFSTGPGTNPYALAVCAGKVFIARYDLASDGSGGGDVGVFDLATGGPLGSVDLSSFDPVGDGNPEPEGLVQIDDMLYVGLQRMDRTGEWWAADPVGKVVEIDCAGQSVVRDWDVGSNPMIKPAPSDMVLVKHDGGVQLVDPVAGVTFDLMVDATLPAGTVTVDAAGTYLGAIHGVEIDWSTNQLWCVDTETGVSALLGDFDQRLWSLDAAPDGMIWALWLDHWATDPVEDGGVAVYDPNSCTDVTPEWMSFAADPGSLSFHNIGN
jgi:hypothetical protein